VVQPVEGGGVREDTPAKVRTAYALMRNIDGRLHSGTTRTASFSRVGKLYITSLPHAIDWYAGGSYGRDIEGYPIKFGKPRDMSEYTVIEYVVTEVLRTPADVWRRQHGAQT